MAKGLSKEADRDYVANNINLAGKLTDAQKIYIPKIGENTTQAERVSTSAAGNLING